MSACSDETGRMNDRVIYCVVRENVVVWSLLYLHFTRLRLPVVLHRRSPRFKKWDSLESVVGMSLHYEKRETKSNALLEECSNVKTTN